MRRFLQYRLRALFILTTLAAVTCAVGIEVIERYRDYREEQKRMVDREFQRLLREIDLQINVGPSSCLPPDMAALEEILARAAPEWECQGMEEPSEDN